MEQAWLGRGGRRGRRWLSEWRGWALSVESRGVRCDDLCPCLPSHEHVPSSTLSLFMTTTTTTTTTTSATTTSTSTIAPTPLQDATAKSTRAWQSDLEALFHRAKDRFPDVVWALLTEGDAEATGEQVYGHKGIYLSLLSISLPVHLPQIHTAPPFSAIYDISTYPNSQLSCTLALHQASRHDISHFALPPHYLQAPWMYTLHPAFLPSPLSLFPLALKSPPYLAPPPPFALHLPFHKVKMA
jgi:hypothetical protein